MRHTFPDSMCPQSSMPSGSTFFERPVSKAAYKKFLDAIDVVLRYERNRTRRKALNKLRKSVLKVKRCAHAVDGYRCKQLICPRCSMLSALKYRAFVDERIRSIGADRVALLTLTVAVDDVSEGTTKLIQAWSRLRQQKPFQCSVLGGFYHVEISRSRLGTRRWCVHLHAVLELQESRTLERRNIDQRWKKTLSTSGLVGTAHIRPCWGF
ncbi:MAG: protein rep [Myxococcota bacterium]